MSNPNQPKPTQPDKPIIPLDPPPPPPPPGQRTPNTDTVAPGSDAPTNPDRRAKTAGEDHEEISRRFPAEILDLKSPHIVDATAHHSAHAH